MWCNVSQLEADRQIAGHWLPSRNDPALNREAARVALRQGSFEPASEASPTGGDPRHRKRDSDVGERRLSSVEHTGDTEEFRKAADMTDDELAAIAAGAKLTVV